MKEKLILSLYLPRIESIDAIHGIVSTGYRTTGNKFWVHFNGSKGYLDHLEISCEGVQGKEKRISMLHIVNKNGTIKKKMLNIFYSDKYGVRLSLGKDEPKYYPSEEQLARMEGETLELELASDDDLPF